jgi:predicted extracellular nuclease
LTATGASDQILIETLVASSNNEVEIVQPQPWRIFIGTNLPIWAIQGDDDRSPYVLDEATTVGVVSGVFPELEGFWIQSAESDDDPLTSEGIFVFVAAGRLSVSEGDLVEVHGHIRETGQQTQIEVASLEDIQVLQQDSTLPLPIELDPPLDDQESQQYYEALEGMLVQVSEEAVATSPTSKYGEYTLVLSKYGLDRVWQGEQAGFLITVDDGSSEVHYDSSTLEYAIQTGDSVTGLQGPLAYTYGVFKIEPLTIPEIIPGREAPQDLTALSEEEFSLMTWNVENLFDILVPHPSDPPLPRKADYDLDLTKIANTILAAGSPTVIGLQEVENLGILEDLAGHELLEGYGYIPILLEGSDSRGIDVGYLVRGDRARVIDAQQYPAPEGLTSRHPLLIQVEVESISGSITLYVINNHFLSMSGGELATEPRRSAQAAWNVNIVERILAEDPDAYVAVLGDLNSYFESKPIDVLREAGLRHVFEILPEEERYTYIYQGASQTLDHILVSAGLMETLKRVEILHADADFPPADPSDSSPLHQSDHDPLVATFGIRP